MATGLRGKLSCRDLIDRRIGPEFLDSFLHLYFWRASDIYFERYNIGNITAEVALVVEYSIGNTYNSRSSTGGGVR